LHEILGKVTFEKISMGHNLLGSQNVTQSWPAGGT